MKRDPAKETSKPRDLSRREMLGLMGSTAVAVAFAGCGTGGQSSSEQPTSASTTETTTGTVAQTAPSCVVRPQQMEGPYFVDEKLNRSDIRTDPSDVRDPGFDTRGQKFLRGYQVTNENGTARFTTIYPGWYQGRTVHIHFKIRTDPASEQGHEFTSQLYFDDSITDRVHTQAPYASKGQRTLKNDGDGIFRDGGDELMLPLTEDGQGVYAGTFDIGLQMA